MLKIFFILLWPLLQSGHDSFMSAECHPDEGVIRVFMKMSHADFRYDYRHMINDDYIFDPSGKIDTTEVFAGKYFDSRVQIFAGNKLLKGRMTGFESADGEINMNLLFRYNSKIRNFKVSSTFMNGVNRNPSTLLIFKHGDYEEDVKLTEGNPEKSFTIK
jgi:hypothetical protein